MTTKHIILSFLVTLLLTGCQDNYNDIDTDIDTDIDVELYLNEKHNNTISPLICVDENNNFKCDKSDYKIKPMSTQDINIPEQFENFNLIIKDGIDKDTGEIMRNSYIIKNINNSELNFKTYLLNNVEKEKNTYIEETSTEDVELLLANLNLLYPLNNNINTKVINYINNFNDNLEILFLRIFEEQLLESAFTTLEVETLINAASYISKTESDFKNYQTRLLIADYIRNIKQFKEQRYELIDSIVKNKEFSNDRLFNLLILSKPELIYPKFKELFLIQFPELKTIVINHDTTLEKLISIISDTKLSSQLSSGFLILDKNNPLVSNVGIAKTDTSIPVK